MIVKTEAIVLKIIPIFETSHIVVWLTKKYGKVFTIIKGALRPKSFFLGQYDLFYTCELLYYANGLGGLNLARECMFQKSRPVFSRNWRAFALASYVVDLISHVAVIGVAQTRLYEFLESVLDSLEEGGNDRRELLWFELKLLGLLGFSPRLDICLACTKKIELETNPIYFSVKTGGVLCHSCVVEKGFERNKMMTIGPDVLSILRAWQKTNSMRFPSLTRCTDRQLKILDNIINAFLGYYLDLSLPSREIVLNLNK